MLKMSFVSFAAGNRASDASTKVHIGNISLVVLVVVARD